MVEKLAQTIQDYAIEIYKQTKDLTSIRRRGNNVVVAAGPYYACRMEPNLGRTYQEIANAANEHGFAVEVKEIASVFKKIREQHIKIREKDISMEMAVVNLVDYVRRFCSHLRMNYPDDRQFHQFIEVVTATITSSKDMLQRKPTSLVATAIFKHAKDKTTLKAVSEATGVAERTISQKYRD